MRRGSKASGFTLAELLVGMVISTLILGAASGVFVTTLRSWEKGSLNARLLQAARTTGDLLEKHLRSAVSPATGGRVIFKGVDLSVGKTYGHRLVLASAASGLLHGQPPTDMSEVEFLYDPAEKEGLTMRIKPVLDELHDEGGTSVQLSEAVQSFQVLYFDGVDWVEEWDKADLPQAVEFHLTFVEHEEGPFSRSAPRYYNFSRLVVLPTAARGASTL